MPEAPYVRLNAGGPVPNDLFTQRTPEQALIASMLNSREYVVREAKQRVKTMPVINPVSLTQMLESIWLEYLPTFRRSLAGVVASGYLDGYRKAQANDIDPVVLNALAEQFSDRVGMYWNQSSREAVVEGFNIYVNRKVPQRAAAERALDAYGLTPRQMRGYTSNKFDSPVDSAVSIDVKRRVKEYIGQSLRQRLSIFATQEAHNLDQQAQQMAWLWMQKNGQISESAEKVWLTARDERVCATCGPLHGKRAKVGDRFEVKGQQFWTPGLHTNCRCEIRLVDVEAARSYFGKADSWYNDEYKRTSDGRFASVRAKLEEQAKNPRFAVKERTGDVDGFQSLLDTMFEEKVEEKPVATSKPKAVSRVKAISKPKAVSRPKAESKTDEKASATSARVTAGSRRTKVESSQMLVRSRQTAVQASVLEAVRALKATTPPVKGEKQTSTIRNTVKLPRPVYAAIPGYMLDTDGQLLLDETIEFYDDEHRVAMWASEMFNDEISNTVEQIYDQDPPTTLIEYEGEMVPARVAEEDVWELVGNTAWEFNTEDPDWHPHNVKYGLEIQDAATGDWVHIDQTIDHPRAQSMFELHPEMFQVVIVRLDEGYDDPAQGTTYMDQAGSQHGYETWVTQGTYGSVETGPTHNYDRRSPSIRTVALTPLNIEEEIIESIEDDANEWHE